MAKKKLIHFKLTRGWELFFLVLMLASLMALFQETSIFREVGIEWRPHLIGSVDFSGLWAFWVTVIIFHIALFFVIARSVAGENAKKHRTATWLDFVAGFVAVVGIYFILTSTIYWLYKGQTDIEFLGNISSLVLLRLGFVLEAIICIWYGITE
jgi:hypothetical protein